MDISHLTPQTPKLETLSEQEREIIFPDELPPPAFCSYATIIRITHSTNKLTHQNGPPIIMFLVQLHVQFRPKQMLVVHGHLSSWPTTALARAAGGGPRSLCMGPIRLSRGWVRSVGGLESRRRKRESGGARGRGRVARGIEGSKREGIQGLRRGKEGKWRKKWRERAIYIEGEICVWAVYLVSRNARGGVVPVEFLWRRGGLLRLMLGEPGE
eukprot:1370219-Amorphochlora_amoeboformis.AAC.1